MNQHPFSTEGLDEDDIELFTDTYTELRSFCDARFLEEINIDIDLKNFECLNEYDRFSFHEVIQVAENAYIAIAEVSYSYAHKSSKNHVNQFEAWGIASLQKDFGDVFIKPEGIKEKLIEIIKPIELDIVEDPKFSKQFYVLAKDKQKAIAALNTSFREALLNSGLTNFALEIHQNMLIIGNNKFLSSDDAVNFARFVDTVSKIR
jgi:hypothetical protein